jgi:hypothetical protein
VRVIVAAVVCSLALVLVGGAVAAQTIAPPGNSGVDQYFETIPEAGGNVQARRPAVPAAGSTGPLARLGRDGRAASVLAAATTPIRPSRAVGIAGSVPPVAAESPPSVAAGSASALGALLRGSDGGGLGAGLPALLVGAVIAAVVSLVLRRRSRTADRLP